MVGGGAERKMEREMVCFFSILTIGFFPPMIFDLIGLLWRQTIQLNLCKGAVYPR